MRIGEKIKIIRENEKMSQGEMAKSLHVSNQAISNWERGKSYPDISNLIGISDLYGISLDELIREDFDYKEVLLDKKITKTVDLAINALLFVIVLGCLSYAYVTNKINDSNHFAVIVGVLIIVHTGYALYRQLTKSLKIFF